jgi:hypothetical protein
LAGLILGWAEKTSLDGNSQRLFQVREMNLLFFSEEGRNIASKHLAAFNQYTLFLSYEAFDRYQLLYP